MNKQEQLDKLKELYETTYTSTNAIGVEVGLTGETVRAWSRVIYSEDYRKERKRQCYSASKMGDKNPNFGIGNFKHGEARTRLHICWTGMKQRATKREDCNVFPEWEEYVPFATWARANGYADGLVLCRTNDTGGYEPSNVRWDTPSNNVIEGNAKHYEFMYEGELIHIYNLNAYCKERGLNCGNLHNVWTKRCKQSQGYSLPEH
jgi:hypothetical protein